MLKALYTAASGMRSQQTQVDVIANNLANVNTAGFKKSDARFEDLLYVTMRNPGAANKDGSTIAGLQLGSGSQLVATTRSFEAGTPIQTGNPLDLAIQNQIDRFSIAIDVIDRVPSLRVAGAHAKEKLKNMQIECQNYAYEHGIDKPDIDNWKWPG